MPTFDKSAIIGKPFDRSFTFERELKLDETERTAEICFSSEEEIYHWFGYIILDHDPKSVRMERINQNGALLWNHDADQMIGACYDARIDDDRKGRCTVKFSESSLGQDKFRDVQQGICRSVSVRFAIYDLTPEIAPDGETQKMRDGNPVYRCSDWEIIENSLVSIPADVAVGVGRGLDPETILNRADERKSTNEEKRMENELETPAAPAPGTVERSALQIATDEIMTFARSIGVEAVAQTFLQTAEGAPTVDAFRSHLRTNQPAPTPIPAPGATETAERGGAGKTSLELARSMPRHKPVTAFDRGNKDENANAAFRFGSFMLATALRNYGNFSRSMQVCKDYGILNAEMIRALSEGVNSKGGFLVPVEFGNDLIDLRLKYGVFRRNAHLVQMTTDTRTDPRRVSGLTTAFVNESQLIPESDLTWDRVTLVAKKLAAYAVFSSELDEDAVIDLGNTLANEIAYAFAKKEDECGFIGDGSSAYGGIVGILPTLRALDATIGNVSGIKVGTGNAFSELTLQDFLDTMGLMPDYVDTAGDNAKWYVNKAFYFNVMAKLMLAGGGVTASEIEDRRMQRFLGYPVEFVNVLNKVEGNSVAVGLFGDLAKAATMGVRRDTTIQESEHVRFQYDDIVIKGTERFDINVHSVGNATSVAADKQPGPMVALYTAAS